MYCLTNGAAPLPNTQKYVASASLSVVRYELKSMVSIGTYCTLTTSPPLSFRPFSKPAWSWRAAVSSRLTQLTVL